MNPIYMYAPRDPWFGIWFDRMDAEERQALKDALNPFSSKDRVPMIITKPSRKSVAPLSINKGRGPRSAAGK